MATSIFELFGTIMVDNTKADESIVKTEKKAESLAKSFAGGAKKVAKFGAAVVGAGTAAVGSVTKLASESAAAMDVIDKASQRMEISAESYQEFAHAAELSGVEMSTLEAAAKKLDGDMTFDQAMEEIYALQTAEERAAKAAELFGEGVAYKMTPMINASAEDLAAMKQEAHDLGLVMSEEDVKAGAALNDTLSNLKNSFGAVVTRLGNSLMPVVQKFADFLLKYMPRVQELFDRISPILTDLFDKLMPPLFDLADAILPVIFDVLEAVMPLFTQIAQTVLPIITDLISKLAPIITKIAEKVLPVISKLLEAIMPIIDAIWPVISTILDLAISLLDPLMKLVDVLLPPIISLVDSLTPIIELLSSFLTPLIDLLNKILAPVLDTIVTLLSPLTTALQVLNPLLEVLNGILTPILDVINLILTPVLEFVNWIFGGISDGISAITGGLDGEGGGLLGSLGSVADFLFGDFSGAFGVFGDILGGALGIVGDVLGGVVNLLKDPKQALSDFFNWAADKLHSLWNDVKGLGTAIVEGDSETVKDIILGRKRTLSKADNGLNPEDAQERLSRVRAPGLAEGAVLEPNRPFLAVVGDQTRGTNVEAPLETIRQAVREELDQIVVNVQFNVNNDADRMYEIVKDRSWTERKRTSSVQFG